MISARYEGWITRSNSNGGVWHADRIDTVMVEMIPADAPQDWELGPKMIPGQFGAFKANPICPRGHSPYAFVTGKTQEEVCGKVIGFYRKKVEDWKPVEEEEFSWD